MKGCETFPPARNGSRNCRRDHNKKKVFILVLLQWPLVHINITTIFLSSSSIAAALISGLNLTIISTMWMATSPRNY
jgi:hypothetical protein